MHEPRPTAAEMAHRRVREGLLQLVQGAEVALHSVQELALRKRLSVRGHAVPEEGVVPNLCVTHAESSNLSCLVVKRSLFLGNVVLERLSLRVLRHVVQIRDIAMRDSSHESTRLVMSIVVAVHGVLTDGGSESILGIGKRGESVGGVSEGTRDGNRLDDSCKGFRDHWFKRKNEGSSR